MAQPDLRSHPDKSHQQDREWTSIPNIDPCSTTKVSLSSSQAEDGNRSKTLLRLWIKQCWGCAVNIPFFSFGTGEITMEAQRSWKQNESTPPAPLAWNPNPRCSYFLPVPRELGKTRWWQPQAPRAIQEKGTKIRQEDCVPSHKNFGSPKPNTVYASHWLTWVQGQCHGNCLQCQGRFI